MVRRLGFAFPSLVLLAACGSDPLSGDDAGDGGPIGISHVPMEHSSIVRFVEWEFLDATGQLSARDAEVKSIGSVLDPTTTRVPAD